MEILIIEDDQRLASIIKRGLEENQFATAVACDGEKGLKLALSNDYSLIISDIILPGINGLELCRKIRASKPHIPLLMHTALGTTDDKVKPVHFPTPSVQKCTVIQSVNFKFIS